MIENSFLLRIAAVGICASLTACGSLDVRAQNENPDEPWNWSEAYVRSAVDQVRAGRDLNPDSWPDGARVAVIASRAARARRRVRPVREGARRAWSADRIRRGRARRCLVAPGRACAAIDALAASEMLACDAARALRRLGSRTLAAAGASARG